jgi:DNA-directed RNA polymerase subunit RPC12/RpoP
MINFSCYKCGQSFEAPEEMRGQTTQCPACNARIPIPENQTLKSFASLAPSELSDPTKRNVVIIGIQIPFNTLVKICIKIFLAHLLIAAALAGIYGLLLGILWILGHR